MTAQTPNGVYMNCGIFYPRRCRGLLALLTSLPNPLSINGEAQFPRHDVSAEIVNAVTLGEGHIYL